MEIKQGDIVRYSFPYRMGNFKNKIIGRVDSVGKDSIFVKISENARFSISFKDFDNLKIIGSIEEPQLSVNN